MSILNDNHLHIIDHNENRESEGEWSGWRD